MKEYEDVEWAAVAVDFWGIVFLRGLPFVFDKKEWEKLLQVSSLKSLKEFVLRWEYNEVLIQSEDGFV